MPLRVVPALNLDIQAHFVEKASDACGSLAIGDRNPTLRSGLVLMRNILLAAVLLFSLFSNVLLAGPPYSTSETDIGTLMDDPKALVILQKYIPKNLADPQFEMARMFTLTFIQAHDQHGELSDETLDQIDREFAQLAAEAPSTAESSTNK